MGPGRHGAQRRRGRRAYRGRRDQGAGGAPGPLGQHVRVRHRADLRRRHLLPVRHGPLPGLDARRVRHGRRGGSPRTGRDAHLYRCRAAGARAAVLLAGYPRHRDDPGHRHILRRGRARRRLSRGRPLQPAGRGWTGRARQRDHAPTARHRTDRPAHLPDDRVRVPGLDLRRHRGRDLGRSGLGTLLGLGPRGNLGLHHLGALRRVPARPGHRRLARPGVPTTSSCSASPASCSTSWSCRSSSLACTPTRGSADRRVTPDSLAERAEKRRIIVWALGCARAPGEIPASRRVARSGVVRVRPVLAPGRILVMGTPARHRRDNPGLGRGPAAGR